MKTITALIFVMFTLCATQANAGISIAARAGTTHSNQYNETVVAFKDKATNRLKIVGGYPAAANAFPWEVSLEVSWISQNANAHFCGASIYNQYWLVTAAHCVESLTPDDFSVVAGTIDLTTQTPRNAVAQLFVNPQYVGVDSGYDSAVIKLRDPLVFSKSIAPISLITSVEEKAALAVKDFTVTGWGATVEGGSTVTKLRYVPVQYVPTDPTCNQLVSYNGKITETMLCAGGIPPAQRDACQGDSGGPLSVVLNGTQRLVGIVSWGEGCAEQYKYGVYGRVAAMQTWISRTINAH